MRNRLSPFFAVLAFVAAALQACASAPPLDDASLVEIALASPEDMSRLESAWDIAKRETFTGVGFPDGRGGSVSFSASEYDEYLAYKEQHPEFKTSTSWKRDMPDWPVIRLEFQSSRVLFDPDSSSMPHIVFHRCGPTLDAERRLYGFGGYDVMWRDRLLVAYQSAPRDAKAALEAEGRPQNYEVFFRYTYWNSEEVREAGGPVTLLPLPDDLCVSLERGHYAALSAVGEPLRIPREKVNDLVGPVPRLLFPKDSAPTEAGAER